MKTIIVLMLSAAAWGQTFNGAAAGKLDASNLNFPLPHGTSDPGTCTTGNLFIRTDTSALKMCISTNTWATVSGGGGGTTDPSQALAFIATRTSSTVLTTLQYCASSTPCNFGIGAVYSFVTSPTVTITGGSGSDTLYLYIDSGGTLTAGKNNLTMSCGGACTVVSGVTSFPEGAIPLATWTASSATWDTSGGLLKMPMASTTRVVAGANCTATWTGTAYSVTCAGGSGGPTCDSQTVGFSTVAAGGANPSVEVALTAFSSTAGTTLYAQSTFDEATQFSCGAASALTVSMGRTGANDAEMTGLLPLLQSSGNFYVLTPPAPSLSTYALFLNFVTTGANVNACTAGSLVVRICHF